jgi:hypothetical protein
MAPEISPSGRRARNVGRCSLEVPEGVSAEVPGSKGSRRRRLAGDYGSETAGLRRRLSGCAVGALGWVRRVVAQGGRGASAA